jgi:5-methylcytosine-specific restriction endonuclease McrA
MSAEELAKNREIMYERKETYTIEQIKTVTKDVLFKEKNEADIILDGDIVRGNSQRYQTFFTKGVTCCKCGITGSYFRKERCKAQNAKRYHLNLYAINNNGVEILMTKDHIIPASKGGENTLNNYQTMCELCNLEKGNSMEE